MARGSRTSGKRPSEKGRGAEQYRDFQDDIHKRRKIGGYDHG
jgi:hypothetical protein